jgi:hypothetical protein
MLFTIQTYLEEYLNKRNIVDSDGYAVRLANLYFYYRSEQEELLFLNKVRRIKTVLFSNNGIVNRKEFELSLIQRLDKRYKKKLITNNPLFPGGTDLEKEKLRNLPKLTIEILLNEFCDAIEARAVDAFWVSRKKGTLQHKPEKIGQTLLSLFAKGALLNRSGLVLREFQSGIGFVDVGIIFSSTLHLVEIKIITDDFTGLGQLEQYMKTEKRREGSLLIFDSLEPDRKINLPLNIKTSIGMVKVYRVEINPSPPSSLN